MESLATESGVDIGSMTNTDPALAEGLKELQNPQVLMDPDKLDQIQSSLPETMQTLFTQIVDMLREALSYSLSGVFLVGALVIGTGFLLTFFLKEIPLRQ